MSSKASELYGKSMYELAAGEKIEEEICQEAAMVNQLFLENPDYIKLLSEPSIHQQDRQKLVDDAFAGQIHPYLLNFLKLLMEKGMLGEYRACYKTMHRLYNRDHGITEAVVTTAVPLTAAQKEKLLAKLTDLSGKKVVLEQKIDARVLGGLRVEIDGKLLDGTVQARLRDLRRQVEGTIV